MWSQFFLQNAHFGLNILTAVVMLAVAWLYFDAWIHAKLSRDLLRTTGFTLLAVSFLIYAVMIETNLLATPLFGNEILDILLKLTRVGGYLFIIIGLVVKPIQLRPQTGRVQSSQSKVYFWSGILSVQPFLSGIIAGFYYRHATVGLERHLMPVATGFVFVTLSEIAGLAALFRSASSSDVYSLVSPFGPLWILEHVFLAIAMIIIGRWVFVYLFKRLLSQLLIIFTSAIVIIFIITSVSFTGLLVGNIERQTLDELSTNARVLEFAFMSKQAETLSDTQLVAQSEIVQFALKENLRTELNNTLESIVITKNLTTLVVTDRDGKVVGRGENRERIGEILADDILVKRVLRGEELSSVVTHEGVLAPELSVRSAVAIKSDNEIIGVVIAGRTLDNAFVDNIKAATGLEVSIYGDNRLAATTFVSSSRNERPIGLREEEKEVKKQVLLEGDSYKGTVNFLNRPYYAAYVPIKDVNNTVVGMLFIANPQVTVLQTAARSIETTFILTVGLLIVSLFPIYLISRNLTRQLS